MKNIQNWNRYVKRNFLKKFKFTFSKEKHPFHIVSPSMAPVRLASSVFFLVFFIVLIFHDLVHFNWLYFFFLFFLRSLFLWLKTVSSEGLSGYHTSYVLRGLKIGFVLFILSEVMFFFSFFWGFFHFSLSPSIWIGGVWPPQGLIYINPFGVPLLNTILLVSSGVTITYSHRGARQGSKKHIIRGLLCSILYGAIFLVLQGYEYNTLGLSISDSVYGSIFYILTGFHGLHVIIGLVFLTNCLINSYKGFYRSENHLGLEIAIYYWHFVDVVWIFLYVWVYLWGASN